MNWSFNKRYWCISWKTSIAKTHVDLDEVSSLIYLQIILSFSQKHNIKCNTVCCKYREVHCIVSIFWVAQPSWHHTAVVPAMLIVWPLASWVAALKLWPALSCSTPPAHSVCLYLLDSTHLIRQASQNVGSWKTSLSSSLFNSLSLPFSQFFLCLSVSLSLRLSIYHSQLLSQLLRSHVSERWKGCLTVKKNLQLCFILHPTECCSCLWLSAFTAASQKRFLYHKYLSVSHWYTPSPFSDFKM